MASKLWSALLVISLLIVTVYSATAATLYAFPTMELDLESELNTLQIEYSQVSQNFMSVRSSTIYAIQAKDYKKLESVYDIFNAIREQAAAGYDRSSKFAKESFDQGNPIAEEKFTSLAMSFKKIIKESDALITEIKPIMSEGAKINAVDIEAAKLKTQLANARLEVTKYNGLVTKIIANKEVIVVAQTQKTTLETLQGDLQKIISTATQFEQKALAANNMELREQFLSFSADANLLLLLVKQDVTRLNAYITASNSSTNANPSTNNTNTGSNSTTSTPSTSTDPLEQKYDTFATRFEEFENDYDDLRDDYRDAKEDNDDRDVSKYKKKLENLQEDLEDLNDDAEDLLDDAEDADNSRVEDKVENLIDDIKDLNDDIDSLLGKSKTSTTKAAVSTSYDTPARTTTTSTARTTQPTATTPQDNVVVNTLATLPAQRPAVVQEVNAWDGIRSTVLIGAGLVIIGAILVFLLALIVSRKR